MKRLIQLLVWSISLTIMSEASALKLNSGNSTTVARGATVSVSAGKVYYVRPGGGNDTQCTGLADVDYDGSGTGEACAFSTPFYALGSGDVGLKMVGGDTLIIADGNYDIGYGAKGTEGLSCSTSWAWSCHLSAIPSGTPGRPTRILGANYKTGCATSPKFIGIERAEAILNLEDSNFVEVQCLELTDDEECGQGHLSTPYGIGVAAACAGEYPFGRWARNGIYAARSDNVYLKDIHIHGTGSNGLYSHTLSNWHLDNVDIIGVASAGWSGDAGGNPTNNTGYFRWWNSEISWSGCIESKTQNGYMLDASCTGQNGGNYSDGIGFSKTGGNYHFKNMLVHHNVQDGIDLLYLDGEVGTELLVEDSLFYGNGGNGLKSGPTYSGQLTRDSTIIANCSEMGDSKRWVAAGTNTMCRAGGGPISGRGVYERVSIYTNGDGIFSTQCRYEKCGNVHFIDSILFAGDEVDWTGGDDTRTVEKAALGWNDAAANPASEWRFTNTIVWDPKGTLANGVVYFVNGVETTITDNCQVSSFKDDTLDLTGCQDPGFTAFPGGADGPLYWNDVESLEIDPSSQFFGKEIGDWRRQ